jgi:multidrug efflux pump subunit AcrB
LDGFGRYEYASNPTAMLPVPPSEIFAMASNPNIGQPFSENIYRSVKMSLIMILVLPLSMIGATLAMILFHKPMALPSMLGILLLFGIIIKNAVLLIDFYQKYREGGETPFKSAVESVRIRFRPVMMTTFGTIAGMIPIALENAVGLERLSPFADVAIGGLLLGSLLTLIFIPMFAYIVDGEKEQQKQRLNKYQ